MRQVLLQLPLACLLGVGSGLCGLPSLTAAEVDELVAAVIEDVDPDDLAEPGSTVLAERLAELLSEDLGLAKQDLHRLRLRVAEAWLAAEKETKVEALAKTVLQDKNLPEAEQDRAGLALVAAWELRLRQAAKPDELPDAVAALAKVGEFSSAVTARAWSVEGQRRALSDAKAALKMYDKALALLADAKERQRVPILSLRIIAMERSGMRPDAVKAWLQERQDDPAVELVMADLMTDGDRMIGQPAPALAAPRLGEDKAELFDLKTLKGKPVLVFFMATWDRAQAHDDSLVAIKALQEAHKDLQVLAVSLDTKDSVENLAAYRKEKAVSFPIIGEKLGWDSDLDDAWHVTIVPSLYLVGADGNVLGRELVGKRSEDTVRLVSEALAGNKDAAGADQAADDEDDDEDAIP